MRAMLRLGTAAGACAVIGLVLALVLVPTLGGPDASDLLRALAQEQARGGALDGRRGMSLRCLEGKQEACNELIAGKLTLAEAAERFERLDALLDDGHDALAGPYSGVRGRDEATASVLYWVARSLNGEPSRQVEVLSRLLNQRQGLEVVTSPPAAPKLQG